MTAPRYPLLNYLPIAGALPFMVGALLVLLGYKQIPLPFLTGLSVEVMVRVYALAILCFMSGVHWGQYLSNAHTSTAILVTSNVVTVIGWLGLLVLWPSTFLLMASGLFVVLLAIDWQLARTGAISPTYFRVRFFVTFLVVASLLVAAFR